MSTLLKNLIDVQEREREKLIDIGRERRSREQHYRPQAPECPVGWWEVEARRIKPETRKVSRWGWLKWWFSR